MRIKPIIYKIIARLTKLNGILSTFRFILGKTIARDNVLSIFGKDADLRGGRNLGLFLDLQYIVKGSARWA